MPKEYIVDIIVKEIYRAIVPASNEEEAEKNAWEEHKAGTLLYINEDCKVDIDVEEVK